MPVHRQRSDQKTGCYGQALLKGTEYLQTKTKATKVTRARVQAKARVSPAVPLLLSGKVLIA
jgi:hypothetical protein